ncbi:unnamed protein product [Clonostachys rosea f. rosea IK726]|uniref:Uncharacterized protein n=1 Tax=Clonostachys rosea f. rosea IK726 TaxID=1349383 RepID=A0ACA9UL03_BIOOC|nr:unnamed protein product [Clonostachys rosea f. rosea IK726]
MASEQLATNGSANGRFTPLPSQIGDVQLVQASQRVDSPARQCMILKQILGCTHPGLEGQLPILGR